MTSTDGLPTPLPLHGIRIIDFSRILAGPLTTQVLADLGADVIKVERPGVGDDTRGWGPPFVGDDAAYFLSLNRNKRSITLDLGTAEGAAAAAELTATADVAIENFRPGLMASFGLDAGALQARNPRLVYCSITAFGDEEAGEDGEGSAGTRPGYDIIVQAMSGLMSITGQREGEPVKVGVALLDVITGLYAANGIQAALRQRDQTGIGSVVSVSLFDASVASLVNQAANYLMGGVVPGPMGTEHPNIVPYQVFQASDRSFVLAAGNDRLFERTCEVIGQPDLARDPRYATNASRVEHRGELVPELERVFAKGPAAEWLALLEAVGVPCAPVRRIDDVFASPEGAAMVQEIDDPAHGRLRSVASPIHLNGQGLPVRLPPPALGADNEDLLHP